MQTLFCIRMKWGDIMANMANTENVKLTCKEVETMNFLQDYVSGEESLSPGVVQRIEGHLNQCCRCREEFLLMQQLHEESQLLDDCCNAVMEEIDWEKNAELISSGITFKSPEREPNPGWASWFSFSFNMKWAAAAVMLIFGLGIGLGYLMFNGPKINYLAPGPVAGQTINRVNNNSASLARLENTLAKREVKQYFQQSQLVLTDLMEQCNTGDSFSMQNQLDMKRIRALLGKNRYFNKNLDNPDLMSSKKLLKKIEWLLFEIMMNSDDASCDKLEKLQKYIKKERLLLKIRLAGKELAVSEV